MDYKEKYEMALEGIQEILSSGEDSIKMSRLQLRLQGIFPELKEGEGEKIRKEIIDFIYDKTDTYELREKSNSWLAWLEKQGEQKHKIQPKFKIGDIIRFKGNDTLKGETETHKIVRYDNELYVFDDDTTDLFCEQDLYELVEQKSTNNIEASAFKNKLLELFQKFRFIKEDVPTNGDVIDYVDAHMQELIDTIQKPAEWSDEDEKRLDNAITQLKAASNIIVDDEVDNSIAFIKSLKDRVQPQPKQEWSEEDELNLSEALHHIRMYNLANKADKLDKWLKSLKCRIQPQQEWSEGDEKMLDEMYEFFDKHKIPSLKHDMDDYAKFIKSLKERVQPKQEWSKEDEANLDYLIDFCNGYYNGNKPVLTESTARSLSNWLYRLKSCEIMSNTNKIDNEETEKTIHLACEFIRHHSRKGDSIGGIDCSALIERLKSLRPQKQWKPSEEQMEALKGVQEGIFRLSILESLYNELKKL